MEDTVRYAIENYHSGKQTTNSNGCIKWFDSYEKADDFLNNEYGHLDDDVFNEYYLIREDRKEIFL